MGDFLAKFTHRWHPRTRYKNSTDQPRVKLDVNGFGQRFPRIYDSENLRNLQICFVRSRRMQELSWPTSPAILSSPSSLKNWKGTFLSSSQIGADVSSGLVGIMPGSHLSTNIVCPSICHSFCLITLFLVAAFGILKRKENPSIFHTAISRYCLL